jgi:hypothetical protein
MTVYVRKKYREAIANARTEIVTAAMYKESYPGSGRQRAVTMQVRSAASSKRFHILA